MRFKLGAAVVSWPAFSLTAVAFVALCAGCESGGGSSGPEGKQAAEAQKEALQKKVEDLSAANARKGGATVKFHAKPGAVGGN
jgi:hypothetical protein